MRFFNGALNGLAIEAAFALVVLVALRWFGVI